MRTLFRAFVAAVLFLAVPATYSQQAASSAQQKPTEHPKMTREERHLDKEAWRIDREASDPAGEDRVLTRLSDDLGLSKETLKQQKEQSGLSYGNLFIANSLAKSSDTTFDQITAERKSGKGWGQIANSHNIRLGEVVSGAKRNAKAVEATRRNEERRTANEAQARQEGRENAGMGAARRPSGATGQGRPSRPPRGRP